jgi:ketosteroid isomerase-like protein
MKKIITLSLAFFSMVCLHAQDNVAETEIRKLEQMEVQAILAKDSATLLKLWDKDFTVNAPDNMIYFAGKTTLDRPVLKRTRTSFSRDIENVTIRGNFAFTMGSETVADLEDKKEPGEVIKRRYTNIWEKQPEGWKLVGRHANVICAKK